MHQFHKYAKIPTSDTLQKIICKNRHNNYEHK